MCIFWSRIAKIFFAGLRPAPRWGSAPDPAGAPPQTPFTYLLDARDRSFSERESTESTEPEVARRVHFQPFY